MLLQRTQKALGSNTFSLRRIIVQADLPGTH